MKNYLELKIPVRWNAVWFGELRKALKRAGIHVTWQNDMIEGW